MDDKKYFIDHLLYANRQVGSSNEESGEPLTSWELAEKMYGSPRIIKTHSYARNLKCAVSTKYVPAWFIYPMNNNNISFNELIVQWLSWGCIYQLRAHKIHNIFDCPLSKLITLLWSFFSFFIWRLRTARQSWLLSFEIPKTVCYPFTTSTLQMPALQVITHRNRLTNFWKFLKVGKYLLHRKCILSSFLQPTSGLHAWRVVYFWCWN